jgi:hypothetical protein
MPTASDTQALLDEVLLSLGEMLRRDEPVMLSPKGKPVSLFCPIVSLEDVGFVVANPIPALMAPYIVGAESFQFLVRSHIVRCDKLEPAGKNLWVPLSMIVPLGTARSAERICFSERENARVKIPHPFDGATVLSRQVFDLSSGGMSFRARMHTPFMQVGRVLSEIEIYVNNILREKRNARIVYVKQIIDTKGRDYFQVGTQFI